MRKNIYIVRGGITYRLRSYKRDYALLTLPHGKQLYKLPYENSKDRTLTLSDGLPITTGVMLERGDKLKLYDY